MVASGETDTMKACVSKILNFYRMVKDVNFLDGGVKPQ